jgi:hypothetical protein
VLQYLPGVVTYEQPLVCTLLAFAVAISFRLASDQQLAIEEV